MKTTSLSLALLLGVAAAGTAAEPVLSVPDLRATGAFGFPQKESKVVFDQPALRFSVWNNDEFLFAQAVLWTDGDGSLGKTEDNREIGDWSQLMLDLDADGKATASLDRDYILNPWPSMQGLHYQILTGAGSSTALKKDSKGRGAVRFVQTAPGQQVRVDTFLVPMAEISRKVGDKIQICYWGSSAKPRLTVNAAGYDRKGQEYYGHHIPRITYRAYELAKGGELDPVQVPEGRNDISISNRKEVPMPKVGEPAREIAAQEWVNLKERPTLESLRGKVVMLEFWATWCGPCVEGIPHLNELSKKYAGKDFQLLSFVEEGHKTMDKFLARHPVQYPIGLESTALEEYGISGIPHAFVLDRKGRILWHGHTDSPALEKTIANAIKKK